MNPMRIRARHYATGEPIDITIDRGVITAVGLPDDSPADVEAGWVAPSFFDIQVNGCEGISFSSAAISTDDVARVAEVCRAHGLGGFCPTLVTNSHAALTHGFRIIARAAGSDAQLAAMMPAFHLEGPYISSDDGPRGAHPREYVRPPDWGEFKRLQDAAGGRIKLVTVAPELNGMLPFIGRLVASGVVVAIGHTAATAETIRDAITAGAKLSTHLGNGCASVLPRHDNCLWEQLAADELWASVIADGHHLPPAVLRCILRMKTPARTILISDASALTFSPPGRYRDLGQDVDVLPDGQVVIAGSRRLAGSGVFADTCVSHSIQVGALSLKDAIDCAAVRPRELLGLKVPRIAVGEPSDLCLFDFDPRDGVRIRRVIRP